MHSITFGNHAIVTGNWDAIYSRYLREILTNGDSFVGRNGQTRSLFGCQVTVDLQHGFPLTRLRKMPMKNLFREFLFDIGFTQNVEALGPAAHFWDFLADDDGWLGASAYSRQWRMWPPSHEDAAVPNEKLVTAIPVDQLLGAIWTLKESPNSRHATVITHNPTAIDPSCPPCHLAMQFMPRPDGSLDLMVPARSNDMVVGFPLDIARYAIMLHVVAAASGFKAGRLTMPSANSHIYENCYKLAEEMIKREVKPECQLALRQWSGDLLDLDLHNFVVTSYDPHEAIRVAVN